MKFSPWYIVLGLVAAIGVWVWSGYNGLVTSEERLNATWAQVEVQYQRRFDLIPNLVSTVRGAADFEQETFTAITEARTQWQGASSREGRVEAANALESGLGRLLVTVENYPQLQATQSFRDLMVQLEGTENRIAVARRDYNEIVRQYNLRVRRFPGNMLASFFGYEPEEFLESAEGSDEAPSVEF